MMRIPLPTTSSILVHRALDDDPRALEALVLRHAPCVHAVARAVGVPAGSVEDVAQETFLRAVRDLRQLRDPERFGAWLIQIARNAGREWLRTWGRASGAEPIDRAGPGPEPFEEIAARELHDQVHRRVLELPEDLRDAVYVYYYEGKSTRRAARALGISTAALWHRLKRARDLLRQRLWRQLGESLRESVPSRTAWRASGRKLSLLLLAALPLSTRSNAAATASSWVGTEITGGLIMSGKKMMIAAGIAACVFVGGAAWMIIMQGSSRARPELASQDRNGARPAVLEPTSARDVSAAASRGAGASSTPPGEAKVVATRLPAIAGRIVSPEGAAIAGASVKVIGSEGWREVVRKARAGDASQKPAERLNSLRFLLDTRLQLATSTLSAPDGRFAIEGELQGDLLLFASHESHLTRSVVVLARRGATVEIEIELPSSSPLEGTVTDAAGGPIAQAEVRAERADFIQGRSLKGFQLALEGLEQGSIPAASIAARTGLDGRFKLSTLDPVEHTLITSRAGFVSEWVRGAIPGGESIRIVLDAGATVKGRVVSAGAGPLGGARVRFEPVVDREVHRIFTESLDAESPEPPAPVEVGADRDGRFEASGLVEGKLRLTVSASLHPRLERDVEIPAGGADLGDIVVEQEKSIAGLVKTPAGAPAAGARIAALEPARGVRSSNWVAQADRAAIVECLADSQGRFRLAGLPPGEHDVLAELAGFVPAVSPGVKAGSTGIELMLQPGVELRARLVELDSGAPIAGAFVASASRASLAAESDERGGSRIAAVPVELLSRSCLWVRATNAEHDASFELPVWTGGEVPSIRLARKETISGTVLASDGSAVAGARVTFETLGLPEEARGYNPATGIESLSTLDGSFVIDAPVGLRRMIGSPRCALRASHPRLGVGRGAPFQLPAPGESWPRQALTLQSCRVEGTVRSEDGGVVAGAWVRVSTDGEARAGISRKDGTYTIECLGPGASEVLVRAAGYAPWRSKDLVVAGELTRFDVQLDRGGSVSGRVVDESGAGLLGADVIADPAPEAGSSEPADSFSTRMRRLELEGLARARTDDEGRYRFDRLPAGELRIVARRSGYEAAEAKVPAGGTAPDLVLARFAAIAGRVIDAKSGLPILKFDLDVIDLDKLASKGKNMPADYRTASEGELTIEDPAGAFVYDGLRTGRFDVIVRARGFLSLRRETEARAGELVPIELSLERGGRIEGVVLDAETAQPVAGAEINAMRSARGPIGPADFITAWSGLDGRFSLEGLADGDYSPSASHRFYKLSHSGTPVKVSSTEAPSIELRLEPAGALEGRVVAPRGAARVLDAAGKPPGEKEADKEQRSVGLEPLFGPRPAPGTGGLNSCPLDPDGCFHLYNLEPGRYKLTLESQRMGEMQQFALGPNGSVGFSTPLGKPRILWSAEVEIEARRTTVQDIAVAPAE